MDPSPSGQQREAVQFAATTRCSSLFRLLRAQEKLDYLENGKLVAGGFTTGVFPLRFRLPNVKRLS